MNTDDERGCGLLVAERCDINQSDTAGDFNRIDADEPNQAAGPMLSPEQRLGDFLALLGHELRNPLAGIESAIQVLEAIGSQDADVNEMRDIIKRQSQHMSRLIDDLLDVSRITHGKLELQLQRIDLVELVRCTCADFHRSAASSGIALEVELPAQPLWLIGDATRIQQVLVNLLQNAVKFTDLDGSIAVALRRNADRPFGILSVRDTGIGMEPHILASIFEPFSQGERGLKRSREGLGLGLALVRGLVEMHGGRVTVSSEGLGRGSEFSVRLPLAAESVIDSDQPVESPLSKGCYRILIIDDRRDAVYPLKTLLTRMGHEMQIAADGEIGVTVAKQFRPHIVLCDIGLPGEMDGFAVAVALRDDMHTRDAYLVAATGYTREEVRCRAMEAGFDRHLTKPLGIQELESIFADLGQSKTRPLTPHSTSIHADESTKSNESHFLKRESS